MYKYVGHVIELLQFIHSTLRVHFCLVRWKVDFIYYPSDQIEKNESKGLTERKIKTPKMVMNFYKLFNILIVSYTKITNTKIGLHICAFKLRFYAISSIMYNLTYERCMSTINGYVYVLVGIHFSLGKNFVFALQVMILLK